MASRGLSFTGHKLSKSQALAHLKLSAPVKPHQIPLNGEGPPACDICQRDFRHSNEPAVVFCNRCRHVFGRDCLYEWLEQHSNSCPWCRAELYESQEEDESQQVDRVLVSEVEHGEWDTEWGTDNEGRPIPRPDNDWANLETMRVMASNRYFDDLMDMVERRAALFQAGELQAAGNHIYSRYDRQNFTFGLALPAGRYAVDAESILQELEGQYLGALESSLGITDDQLHVAAHPISWIAYDNICSTLKAHWQAAPGVAGLPSVGWPRVTAEELEADIRARLCQNSLLANLRRDCMPGGKYPERLNAFVSDMVENVLEMAVGEEGLKDYNEGRRTAGARMPW